MKKILTFSVVALLAFSSCKNTVQTGAAATEISQLSDKQLMDRVQRDALKYFWDYAEPNSLMGRERYHEDFYPKNDANVVTTGGSGFGLMTILVGIERGLSKETKQFKG